MILQPIPLFISGAEIFFILFIVLLVFGADKVPEIARGLGKGMRQIKDATNDIKREITKSAEKEGIDLDAPKKFTENLKNDITQNITKKVDNVRDNIEDITGPVKRKKL